MRLCWTVPMCAAVLISLPAGAFAQGLLAPTRTYGQPETYQTPGYRPPTPSSLDKTYGLPTLGLEAPKQKTMAPEKNANAPAVPDFFTRQEAPDTKADQPSVPDFFADAPPITLPKQRAATAGASGMETPRFTTSDGSALNDTDTTGSDTMTRTPNAGLSSGVSSLSDNDSGSSFGTQPSTDDDAGTAK